MKLQSHWKRLGHMNVRLMIEAVCPKCGPLPALRDKLSVVFVAENHTAETGHVVALNGTTDRPEAQAEKKRRSKVVEISASEKWSEV